MSGLPSNRKLDVIIIGAGVSGLEALAELDKAGAHAVCIEARNRIGGRILTVHDAGSPIPIELGAEFIHGRPPETWTIIDNAGLAAYDCGEEAVHIEGGKILDRANAWLPVDEIMTAMAEAADHGPDQTFASFLAGTAYPKGAKRLATSYVQGFNAAHDDRIGIASLALDSRAADAVQGDRSFRLMNGYDAIPAYLLRQIKDPVRGVQLNSVAESVRWSRNSVSVNARSRLTGEVKTMESRHLVVTVPLGVLQADQGQVGAIHFEPEPVESLRAARKLCFGQVFRTVFRFSERIWEKNKELSDAGFLLSDEAVFPTWWTPLPFRVPLITGWSAGRNADPLLHVTREEVINSAMERLGRVASVDLNEVYSSLMAAHFHDWSTDPYSRGAYSYVPVGGVPARELLAQPVEETLFFAGEATETDGHSATVHGAIASGKRAARQILKL